MVFIRKIKKSSGTYLAKVESYRDGGKIKQRVIEYLGREVNNKPVRRVSTNDLEVVDVKEDLAIHVVHSLAKELELLEFKNKYWLILVYSHLLENRSITKLSQWIEHTTIPDILDVHDFSSRKLYDSLSDSEDQPFSLLEKTMHSFFSTFEKEKMAAVIDVTDIYFEGKSIPSKRRKGKDGKVKKLLQIGLAVSLTHGFPVMHKTYDGNLSNKCIFNDMALDLKKKGITSLIMDRGMLSAQSLKDLLRVFDKIK